MCCLTCFALAEFASDVEFVGSLLLRVMFLCVGCVASCGIADVLLSCECWMCYSRVLESVDASVCVCCCLVYTELYYVCVAAVDMSVACVLCVAHFYFVCCRLCSVCCRIVLRGKGALLP